MRTTIRAACATLLPAIAVLLTLIFCSYRAGFISVSCDEFAKMMIASRGLDQPSQWFAYVWLPLHLVMIGVTSLATGDLFLASRLISIIFGIVLVVALWGIGRQLAGVWGGALAAILGATHPLVVVLSATAMVDICYVATLVLGVSFYLRFSHAQAPRPRTLFAACSLFTLSCAFHYNAWIAVLLMVPLLLRDLVVGRVSRPIMVAGLVIVGSVPCGWIGWNWIETGNPLAFFSAHSDYSANFWAHNGWHASAGAGAEALFASIRVYSPLIAILTLAAVGALFGRTQTGPRPRILWALLLGFLAALVGLYATGGRPAAFEPRYILLPSVLMISIVSAAIFRLGVAGNRQIRAFLVLLSLAAVIFNLRLWRDAIEINKKLNHYAYTAEAQKIARRMPGLRSKHAPRMVLEIKAWNFLELPVFLNRDDAILADRDLRADSVHHFDNRSILLGEREPVLAELRVKGVGFVALWSPEVRAHVKLWGLERVAQAASYTIYRIPRAPGQSELTAKNELSALGGAHRR